MVTARGRPSGMAHTTTEIAIIIVSKISDQSLLSKLSSKVNCLQSSFIWQANMFWHPHGTNYIISKATLKTKDMRVKTAQPIPTNPIFSAILASFFWRRV